MDFHVRNLGWHLHRVPRRVARHARTTLFPRHRRPPAPGAFIDVDGMRVHVETRGSGSPSILLLHGYLGSTATWYPAMPLLARHLRVVAVDLPGGGYAARPRDASYTLPWFAELLPRLLDALDLHRPFIAAHSFGGAVALHALARNPSLARGLVLISPLVQGDRPPPGLRFAERFPGVARAFFGSPVGRAVMPALVRRAGFTTSARDMPLRARRLLGHLDAAGGWEAATRMGLSAANHAPGPDVLRRVTVPCLLFWGRHDPVHSVDVGHRLLRQLGGPATLKELPVSHNCHDEAADAFAAHVLDWVSTLSTG
ncbi:MAG: alpha/beta hydrolase [Myxococcota bacterium]